MGVFDRFRKLLPTNFSKGTINTSNNPDAESVDDFGGNRTTLPKFVQGGGGVFGALPKRTQRDLDFTESRLGTMGVEDLIDVLMDAHPDVSFAVWNFMRIGQSGYSIRVEDLEETTMNEDPKN